MPHLITDTFSNESKIVLYPGCAEDFLKSIPENSASLIITSPPYNLGKEYEEHVAIEKYLDTQRSVITQLYEILSIST